MKLIVTKCSSPSYWYSECIGMTFTILETWDRGEELLFRTNGHDNGGYVGAEDCELLIKGYRFAFVPKAIETTEQPSEAGAVKCNYCLGTGIEGLKVKGDKE